MSEAASRPAQTPSGACSSTAAATARSPAADVPADVLSLVLSLEQLGVQDIAASSSVCTAWRAAAERAAPWDACRRRAFPAADPATVSVLRERARATSACRCVEREVFRWLAQQWNCERCQQPFTDGGNTPTSCLFHPGILFSGGQLNGAGLRYTCCNRRAHHIPNGSRDANGCVQKFHCGGQSAWQRHGAGVAPRELPPDASPACAGGGGPGAAGSPGSGSPSRSSSSPGSAPGSPSRPSYPFVASPGVIEWHPNQRPGLLELPSRLFGGAP